VFVNATGRVGSAAGAERDAATFEVSEKFGPPDTSVGLRAVVRGAVVRGVQWGCY
jgi:hypothetical protein